MTFRMQKNKIFVLNFILQPLLQYSQREKGRNQIRIRTCDSQIRMRAREAQKHTDPTDLDADSEHWYIYIIHQR